VNTFTKVLFRRLVRTGVKRGLIDGSRLWLYVGAISWVVRTLTKQRHPVVRRETLEPGETLVVTNVDHSKRSMRRQSKEQPTE